MLELHDALIPTVCMALDDAWECYAKLQLVPPCLLPYMLCSLGLHHVHWETPYVNGPVERLLCWHQCTTSHCKTITSNFSWGSIAYLLHAIRVSPRCNADSSKQSSRSPSTLPYAASRCPSSTSLYPEALGHSHLLHRALTQGFKPSRTGTEQPAQHHVRLGQHSGEDIGWKLYCTASFTTALSMVMAELAKQVEVQCSERAHALALTWNLYSAAMDTCQGMSS